MREVASRVPIYKSYVAKIVSEEDLLRLRGISLTSTCRASYTRFEYVAYPLAQHRVSDASFLYTWLHQASSLYTWLRPRPSPTARTTADRPV